MGYSKEERVFGQWNHQWSRVKCLSLVRCPLSGVCLHHWTCPKIIASVLQPPCLQHSNHSPFQESFCESREREKVIVRPCKMRCLHQRQSCILQVDYAYRTGRFLYCNVYMQASYASPPCHLWPMTTILLNLTCACTNTAYVDWFKYFRVECICPGYKWWAKWWRGLCNMILWTENFNTNASAVTLYTLPLLPLSHSWI